MIALVLNINKTMKTLHCESVHNILGGKKVGGSKKGEHIIL